MGCGSSSLPETEIREKLTEGLHQQKDQSNQNLSNVNLHTGDPGTSNDQIEENNKIINSVSSQCDDTVNSITDTGVGGEKSELECANSNFRENRLSSDNDNTDNAKTLAESASAENVKEELGDKHIFVEKDKKTIADDLDVTFEDLKPLELHASKAPDEETQSIERLAKYLTRTTKTQIEMAWVFYVWICKNIRYKIEYLQKKGIKVQYEAEGVLQERTTVCEGYANLYLALCREVNIQCEKLSGYSKGASHSPGDEFSYIYQTDHAWNAVFIEGKWRLVETTWGGGRMNNQQEFVSDFTPFFFLTKPEHFIEDHFPHMNRDAMKSGEWQLLKSPKTLDEFSKGLKRTVKAKEWDVHFPGFKNEVILFQNKVQIPITCEPLELKSVTIVLFPLASRRGNIITSVSGYSVVLKESLLRHRIIVRPNKKGKYLLEVYGTITSELKMPLLASFLLDCSRVRPNVYRFPQSQTFYGPQKAFYELGVNESIFPSPTKSCINGKLHYILKLSKTVEILANITNEKGETYRVETSDISTIADEAWIRTRIDKPGFYQLQIFAKLETSCLFESVLTVLVDNPLVVKKGKAK